jgi:hypothetical protein
MSKRLDSFLLGKNKTETDILLGEVRQAISSLKNGQSPGANGISSGVA